ncbi:MAG: hypothetical protein PVG66_10345 [Chromatiales bacterium]|jgi:hypothetical protein
MKTWFALLLLLASGQVSAFGAGDYYNATGNHFLTSLLNGFSEGDFKISMNFKSTSRSKQRVNVRGYGQSQLQNYSYQESYRGHFINLGNGFVVVDGVTERAYNTGVSLRDSARNRLDSHFSSRNSYHGKPYLVRTSPDYRPLARVN